tara:strand:+ start:552 stop:920 length:369 start_codon:yes stop_codon:yes gene_type:complete
MLRDAKSQCDHLIVGLQIDPTLDRPEKNKPIQTILERHMQLDAVKYVDEIVLYSTEKDLRNVLSMYAIDVRIIGEEYKGKDFTGKNICRQRDIEIFFNKREHKFSTTELRKRIWRKHNDEIL